MILSSDARLVFDGLIAAAPVGLAMAGWALLWARVHRRRAARWREVASGSRSLGGGLTVAHGKVRADGDAAAIVIEIEQAPHSWSGRGGVKHVDWKERARRVRARPFELVQANGRSVRVEPDERVQLIDKLGPGEESPTRRTVIAKLEAGEEVHVVGRLEGGAAPGSDGGPYRDAAADEPALRPPNPRRMLISAEPLDAPDRRRAGLHDGARRFWLWFIGIGELVCSPFWILAARGGLAQFVGADHPWIFGSSIVFSFSVGFGIFVYAGLAWMRDGWYDEEKVEYTEGWSRNPFRGRHDA